MNSIQTEKNRQRREAWRQENPEKNREIVKQWRKQNPDKFKAYQSSYREFQKECVSQLMILLEL